MYYKKSRHFRDTVNSNARYLRDVKAEKTFEVNRQENGDLEYATFKCNDTTVKFSVNGDHIKSDCRCPCWFSLTIPCAHIAAAMRMMDANLKVSFSWYLFHPYFSTDEKTLTFPTIVDFPIENQAETAQNEPPTAPNEPPTAPNEPPTTANEPQHAHDAPLIDFDELEAFQVGEEPIDLGANVLNAVFNEPPEPEQQIQEIGNQERPDLSALDRQQLIERIQSLENHIAYMNDLAYRMLHVNPFQ